MNEMTATRPGTSAGNSGVNQSIAVVAPLTHSVLRKIGTSSIRVFVQERERYLAAVAERNASEHSQVSPQSVLASTDRGTLKSLVMLR